MEFRKQASSQYAHFIYYSDTKKRELDSRQQTVKIMEELSVLLKEKSVDHLIGYHLHKCLHLCDGVEEEEEEVGSSCITYLCQEQLFGNKNYGKCILFSRGPSHTADSRVSPAENHVHILLHIPKPTKFENPTQILVPKRVNWDLEMGLNAVKEFFEGHIYDGFSYRVILKQVHCPFSVYATFYSYDSTVCFGNMFCDKFKRAFEENSDNRAYFPKRSPYLTSKNLWELHVVNAGGGGSSAASLT